jgi:hypothetical protein
MRTSGERNKSSVVLAICHLGGIVAVKKKSWVPFANVEVATV